MLLYAIKAIVDEYAKDGCFRFFSHFSDDNKNLRALQKLYNKFSSTNPDPMRVLSTQEFYECEQLVFNAAISTYTKGGDCTIDGVYVPRPSSTQYTHYSACLIHLRNALLADTDHRDQERSPEAKRGMTA